MMGFLVGWSSLHDSTKFGIKIKQLRNLSSILIVDNKIIISKLGQLR